MPKRQQRKITISSLIKKFDDGECKELSEKIDDDVIIELINLGGLGGAIRVFNNMRHKVIAGIERGLEIRKQMKRSVAYLLKKQKSTPDYDYIAVNNGKTTTYYQMPVSDMVDVSCELAQHNWRLGKIFNIIQMKEPTDFFSSSEYYLIVNEIQSLMKLTKYKHMTSYMHRHFSGIN